MTTLRPKTCLLGVSLIDIAVQLGGQIRKKVLKTHKRARIGVFKPHQQKNKKMEYLRNRISYRDETLHSDARHNSAPQQNLKIEIFKNSNGHFENF